MIELRPYQEDIVKSVAQHVREGQKKILIQLETGGGKTVIAGFLTRSIVEKRGDVPGCLCLYLVHRKELINQVADTLDQAGMGDMVGIIQSGRAVDKSARLQVASVQTLARRMDEYKSWLTPQIIFVDEAHHIRANTWEMILQHYSNSYLVGMTATPARLDGKGLGKHFDCMVQGWSTEKLIEHGYLADMDCYSIETSFDLDGLKKQAGDYNKKQLKERTGTTRFRADIVDAFLEHCMNRRVIHYTSSVDDSLNVRDKLLSIGIKAAHIDGKTPDKERDSIIDAFGRGDVQVLTNVEIVTEGFDVPDCDAIILSRKTASAVLFRQMVGRARRPKKDGKKAILVDLVGNMIEHDHPDTQPKWDLEDGIVKEEKRTYADARICKSCGFSPMEYVRNEGWKCSKCGHKKMRMTIKDIKMALKEKKKLEAEERTIQYSNMKREVRESMGVPAVLEQIIMKYGVKSEIKWVWKQVYGEYWERQRRINNPHWRA